MHKTKPVYNISKRECEGLMTACVNNPPESADVVDTAAPDRHMTTTQEKQDIKKEGKKGEKQIKKKSPWQTAVPVSSESVQANKNLSAIVEQLVEEELMRRQLDYSVGSAIYATFLMLLTCCASLYMYQVDSLWFTVTKNSSHGSVSLPINAVNLFIP